jgi:hypothetical protein
MFNVTNYETAEMHRQFAIAQVKNRQLKIEN